MKKNVLLTFLLLALLLAACASETAEPTTAPVAPTAAPQSEAPVESIPLDMQMLTGTTWAWIRFTDPIQQAAVEHPLNYTLDFQADGSLAVVADCNNAMGSYTTDGSSLTIEMRPMTMAACPPGSLSDDFVSYFGSAAVYFFEEGSLYIDLMADGGTLAFAPADTMMADDGEGAIAGSLTANPWQWVTFMDPLQQFDVNDPANYTLTFQQDGTVGIQADCNSAIGSYSMDGSRISIEVGPMTMAACPPASLSEDFVKYLGFAAIYFFEEGELFIDLFADGGTMHFRPHSGSADGSSGTTQPPPEQGPPERVYFQPGAASASRSGRINQGVPRSYILGARSGQVLTVRTVSHGEQLVISIGNSRGDLLPIEGTNSQINNDVSVVLPESGDFIVTIRPVTLPESPQLAFDVTFTIP